MKNRLIIVGAGGYGKVVADIALKTGYTDLAFVDDNVEGNWLQFPIVGTCESLKALDDGKTDFVIAIGNNAIRQKIATAYDLPWATLVHPSAQIGIATALGEGSVVMANAVINAGATVGKHCIINTGAIIEHDNAIEDFVHISPNAALGGTVRVGKGTHIGIGATVKNNIDICENCIIGAGAMVGKNLTEATTYIGLPAKKMGGGDKK